MRLERFTNTTPSLLDAYADTLRMDLFLGLNGVSGKDNLWPYKTENPSCIISSLQNFASRQTQTGEFMMRLVQEAKEGKDIQEGAYFLSVASGRGYRYDPHFFSDGDYTLFVTNKPPAQPGTQHAYYPKSCGAGISFSIIYSGNIEKFGERGFDMRLHDILILQIQGTKDRGESTEAQKMLSPFRWESVLLSLVSDWAQSEGFPRICVIPAEKSRWGWCLENLDKMYCRYDRTAKRCGFKKDERDGKYVLDFHRART